jgi:hypothetical protein
MAKHDEARVQTHVLRVLSEDRRSLIRASCRVYRLAALGFSAKTVMVGFPPPISGAIWL